MNFSNEAIPVQPCTHTIYRPFGGIEGYRQIRDPGGRLAVTACPLAMVRSLAATGDLSACYVIAGQGRAYIGASNRALKCVAEHAEGPAKAFAAEAFLLHEQEPHTLEWSARLYLEHRLTGSPKRLVWSPWPTRWSRGFCPGLSSRPQRWNGW
ncbi:hypothetical protein [Bradyrhizobium sp. AS23.2]|uniref:hypothetical protein n=1 Tax=Bradyrhizobium sp. AS23.2 TaxID=1680155 RepID=UPI00116106BC|nr:hypothetical protein [Bradyrhizobium sp. AS23.2]